MSSNSSMLQYFATTLQQVLQKILNDPATDMKFVVPILSVIIISVLIRHMSVKETVDSAPELEKKRERFKLPRDRFNVEVDIIMREDYKSYVQAMEKDLDEIEMIRKKFRKLLRKYNRFEYMSRSTIVRRKKKGKKMRKAVLNDMIDTYSEIKRMNLAAITLDTEDE